HDPDLPGGPLPLGSELAARRVVDDDRLGGAGVSGGEDDVLGVGELPEGAGPAVVEPEVLRRGGGAQTRAQAGVAVDGDSPVLVHQSRAEGTDIFSCWGNPRSLPSRNVVQAGYVAAMGMRAGRRRTGRRR